MDPKTKASEEERPEPRDTIPLPPLFLFEDEEDDEERDDLRCTDPE